MEHKNTTVIIALGLLVALALQPLIVYTPALAEGPSENHIVVKAEISENKTIINLDSQLYGKTVEKVAAKNNLIGMGEAYNFDIFYNSTVFHLKGALEVSKNFTENLAGAAPPTSGTSFGSIENLTGNINAHMIYHPETNSTTINYNGQIVFDLKSNQTGGHYVVDVNGKQFRNFSLLTDNVNLVISHSFEITSSPGSIPTTTAWGGGTVTPPSGSQTVTAHTYVQITRTQTHTGNESNSHTHIEITTDDSADWMLIQGLALMMQYSGANVTMPPMGQLPLVGQQNVTVIIDMSKTSMINLGIINASEVNLLNETRPGPFEADAKLNLAEDSNVYTLNIQIDGHGDFSNGVLLPQYGLAATYMSVHTEGSNINGSEKMITNGKVVLKQEDPAIVFLGIKHEMLVSYATTGHDASVKYTFESGSSNIKFLIGDNEYSTVTFTNENATKLTDLRLEYNGTIVGGGKGLIEVIVTKHLPKIRVVLPSMENTTEAVIKAPESSSIIIHTKGGIHANKEVIVNITIQGKHQVLMTLQPGTELSGDINVTVLKTPGEISGMPNGYGLAGPAYKVNANVQGKVMLGIKVDKGPLDSVLVLWVHGSGSSQKTEILHPVKIDEQSRMVFVTVSGFSTFIPIMPMTATTTTSQPTGTQTGTQTSTTSTSSQTQTNTQSTTHSTSSTSTESTSSTGSASSTGSQSTAKPSSEKSNTGVIAGVILLIIILAFAGYYLAKR
jgi:hypothetical protein